MRVAESDSRRVWESGSERLGDSRSRKVGESKNLGANRIRVKIPAVAWWVFSRSLGEAVVR